MRLFRYSGSKSRLIDLYRRIPKGVTRIVEPYLGSGAFSMNSSLPAVGYEINGDLCAMWNWLKTTTPKELHDLNSLVESWKAKTLKPDVRDMNLEHGPQTYVRVNVTGLIIGQLSCWGVYPQHTLPIEETIRCLPRLRDITVIHGRGEDHKVQDGDLLFVDPPYIGTVANYVEKNGKGNSIEKNYDPQHTKDLLRGLICPIIFTYGTNAREVFPEYDWQEVKTIKVPNVRRGGTTNRTEWVSYINFKHNESSLTEVFE
jgi:site-specific DNA-adenine methylase